MARTVQDAITRVQELLQDEEGVRYKVDQLLSLLVDAIEQARSVRPDLFIGRFVVDASQPTPSPPVLADSFPLPDQLFNGTCYFIAGNAELRDDEFAVDGRAMTLKEALNKKLVSGM
jgi:hypothetical protein